MFFEELYNVTEYDTVISVWEESEQTYSKYHGKIMWKLRHVIDIVKGEYPSSLETNKS